MAEGLKLPVVIPDRLLISPGVWNDNEYSIGELNEAFARTKWDDKTKISLWLNHDDRDASAWVGYVKNPRLLSEGRVLGDLELWDEKTALILTKAMVKFGISAKIMGEENKKTGKMSNFSFENFSVVTVPACNKAYINLAQKDTSSKYLISDIDIDEMLEEDECDKIRDSNRIEKEVKKMGETEEKVEESVEEKAEEVVAEPAEEAEEEKELSEKDMLKELASKFDKLIALLSKKLEEEEAPAEEAPVEEAVEEEAEEESEEEVVEDKELTAVKKELKAIREQLSKPKSRTVKNLSSSTVGESAKFDENEFCKLLGSVDRPMKFA